MKMGNFSKASHLSYLGDAEIGKEVNIGAGVVTCNYGVDRKKRKTKIGNKAFIGSGAQLVAPVEIGESAVVGAGLRYNQKCSKREFSYRKSQTDTY